MRSMTGYGECRMVSEAGEFYLTIWSLNRRGFELLLSLPEMWEPLAPKIRNYIQERVPRGTVKMKIEWKPSPSRSAIRFDLASWEQFLAVLEEAQESSGWPISDLAPLFLKQWPERLSFITTIYPEEQQWILNHVAEAVDQLNTFRLREGSALKEALTTHVENLKVRLERLSTSIDNYFKQSKEHFVYEPQQNTCQRDESNEKPMEEQAFYRMVHAKVEEMAQEALRRTHVHEEQERLQAHLNHFVAICTTQGPWGKCLEFILQEMMREINTLLAKIQDPSIVHQGIDIKIILDALKEQVANVE